MRVWCTARLYRRRFLLTRGRVHWYTKGTGHGFIKPDDGGPMAFVRREDLAAGRERRARAWTHTTQPMFLAGSVSSGVVGYLAVRFLLRFLVNHSLRVFAYYRFALAAVVAVVLLTAGP